MRFLVSTLISSSMRILIPAFVLSLSTFLHAEWPQWRGPDGQGQADEAALAVKWSEMEGIAWRTDLPGRGWSSPVVANGQVWMTAAVETPASTEETARRLKTNTSDQPLTLLAQVELRALCVDAQSGKLLHNILLLTKKDPQWVHQLNSYASPSPVLMKSRLYCQFGTLGSACLDTATQKVVWTNEDSGLQIMHENGPGSTPVVESERMIFHMDGSDRQFVAALDTATGKLAWKTARSGEMHNNPQFKKSYGTPLVVTVNGRRQLLSTGSDWLYSYDPLSGHELWKLPYGELGFSITPRPVFHEGMLYMATGFGKGRILAVKIEGVEKPEILWKFDKGAPTQASLLIDNGLLYLASEGGVLTCVDVKVGSEVYRERLGEPFSASPMVAGGALYFPGREGTTYVLKRGREFSKVSENKLAGRQMASFAAEGGVLYIRTDKALYAVK